jgi:AcrR family transcriptional regulator
MAPEDRRAAIIAATIPLLREHGPAVSTRQIAEACGIAEGTIFGVFPDKQSLIQASMINAIDPAPTEHLLGAIDPDLDLRTRLLVITNIVTRRLAETSTLFLAIRRAAGKHGHGHDDAPHGPPPDSFLAELGRVRERTLTAVAAAIEPCRGDLRVTPLVTAKMLMAVVAMNAHPGLGFLDDVSPATIVSVLVDGVLLPSPDRQPPTEYPTPATEDTTSC